MSHPGLFQQRRAKFIMTDSVSVSMLYILKFP